jgi:hypothetical protein
MNSLKNFGTKVVFSMIATGLVAGAAFAASGDTLTINLPEATAVNGSTLASGQYKVTETSMADGSSLLVFRSDKGNATAVVAMKSAEPSAAQKSEVVLSSEGGTLHVDKLFIQGESAGYQFSESK